MKNRVGIMVCALLLLAAGAPTAEARYGGSLLGGQSQGGGGTYTPPAGSAQRRAIMNALRGRVGNISGRYVVFVVLSLRVSHGWAWAVVTPQSPGGGTHYDTLAGLLHLQGGQWTVRHMMNSDVLVTDPSTLQARYPYAPPSIFEPT